MSEAVERAYRQLGTPPGWTPEQTDLFLNLVTQRLDATSATLALELGEQAIRNWTRLNGREPDHQTTVGLHATALENAREATVRNHLYDLAPQQPPQDPPTPTADIPWTQRWRHILYRGEPSEQIEDLADRLWPDRSAMFRVKAAFLLATRLEEQREVPTGRGQRLTRDLEAEVVAAMTAEGYPVE